MKAQEVKPHSIKNKTRPANPEVISIAKPCDLLRHAQELIIMGEHDMAIIRTITALEVFVLNKLYTEAELQENASNIILSKDKLSDNLECLINKSSRGDIKNSNLWSKYQEHVKTRNKIAHLGTAVTRAIADNVLQDIKELIEVLKTLTIS